MALCGSLDKLFSVRKRGLQVLGPAYLSVSPPLFLSLSVSPVFLSHFCSCLPLILISRPVVRYTHQCSNQCYFPCICSYSPFQASDKIGPTGFQVMPVDHITLSSEGAFFLNQSGEAQNNSILEVVYFYRLYFLCVCLIFLFSFPFFQAFFIGCFPNIEVSLNLFKGEV